MRLWRSKRTAIQRARPRPPYLQSSFILPIVLRHLSRLFCCTHGTVCRQFPDDQDSQEHDDDEQQAKKAKKASGNRDHPDLQRGGRR